MFKRTLTPSCYHGNGKKPPFFEGWYYKIVDSSQQHSLAIIPGVFLHNNSPKTTAFIQMVEGRNNSSYYIDFPIDTFSAQKNEFNINIGTNQFTANEVFLDINRNNLKIKGNLKFNFLREWPVTFTSPGIMGWYAWVPFMECFHGIVSLDHSTEGTLKINGEVIDFSGGRGYIEKDWGQAFPEAWVWQQSNHFSEEGVSFTGSIAIIPWIGKAFPGFIIGFLWDKKLYKFATYTGAMTTLLEISGGTVHWIVRDKKYELEVFTKRGSGSPLRAPTPHGMDRQITESVDSFMEVRFSQKIKTGKTVIFQGNGYHAGLEIEGNIPRLLEMVKKADA